MDEVEEEDAGELQQSKCVPVLGRERAGQSGGHAFQCCAELAEKALADRFSTECVGRVRGVARGAGSAAGPESPQRNEGRPVGSVEIDREPRRALQGQGDSQAA